MLRTAQSLPLEWAFDTGLRPRPFPDEAASLLPGPLAVTRTGLTPASDDELTTTDQPPTRSTSCLLGARERLSEMEPSQVPSSLLTEAFVCHDVSAIPTPPADRGLIVLGSVQVQPARRLDLCLHYGSSTPRPGSARSACMPTGCVMES